MTIDHYAELNDEQPDGEFLMDVRTKGPWGIATGVDSKGEALMRVFEMSDEHRQGLSSKQLGLPGRLAAISQNRVDLPLPEGVDAGMVAGDMLDRLHRHGGLDEGHINMHATRAVLSQYGVSDTAAGEASYRREYAKDVVPALNAAFDRKGPSAYADKPSKHAAVLDLLKRDLGVEHVVDAKAEDLSGGSKSKTATVQGQGFAGTTVGLGRLRP